MYVQYELNEVVVHLAEHQKSTRCLKVLPFTLSALFFDSLVNIDLQSSLYVKTKPYFYLYPI